LLDKISKEGLTWRDADLVCSSSSMLSSLQFPGIFSFSELFLVVLLMGNCDLFLLLEEEEGLQSEGLGGGNGKVWGCGPHHGLQGDA
jgi:hypothetical protein